MASLTPPDRARCQAEITVYRPFIMGGSVNQVERCKKPPVWLAKEKTPNPLDKRRGSMSLCDSCKLICEKKMAGVAFTRLPAKLVRKPRARSRV